MNILDLLKPLVFILILVAILAAVLAAVLSAVFSKKNGKKVYPYQAISHLFTPAERSFLGVLDQAVYPSCRAFGKVRVADVLKVKKGMARSDWQAAFNKICSKHFDYVICRASDLRILLVIELDDKSHAKKKRAERDAFVEGATQAAGVPLLRIPCQRSYSLSEISNLVSPYFLISLE